MSLNQQTKEVPSSYGQQLTMKRKHSPSSMTTNTMNIYQPRPQQSSPHKPIKSLNMSEISTNVETLTTKHYNTCYHLHHHVHQYFTSYPKFTNLETQEDQSYQGVIRQRTGFPHSLTSISNHFVLHYHPTSKTQTIFYKPFSTSTHHYHPTPSSPPLMSSHYTPTSLTTKGSKLSLKHWTQNRDVRGHSVMSYTNSSNTYSKKTISHSRINSTSKNTAQRWAPKWLPPLQTYSWGHLNNPYFHRHQTNLFLSCGRDS